ncbi:MAG: heterodisulfide reductase-related iron-sulfur binding cluster, partial [Thermodesulfobacteriota bacterium]
CGVDVKPWSYKTDCCGASFALSRRDIVLALVKKLYDKALEAGADVIVVSCQMCQANLDMYQGAINEQYGTSYDIPILYVTEVMAMAMNLAAPASFLARHIKDPRPYLAEKGMI